MSPPTDLGPLETGLADLQAKTSAEVSEAVERFALHEAVASIWRLVSAGNRYVDQTEPWKLARSDGSGERLDVVLGTLAALVREVGSSLRRFLPDTAAEILRRFGWDGTRALEPGTPIELGAPLFPKRSSG